MKRWEPIAYPGPDNAFGAATHRNFNQGTGERGSWPDAAGYQQLVDELSAVVEKSGHGLDGAKSDQVIQAIRSLRSNVRFGGGTANAIAISLDPPVGSWSELTHVPLVITVPAANTSPDVSLSADGLPPVPIKRHGGGALNIGDTQPGRYYWGAYDGGQFQIISTLGVAPGASTTAAPLLQSVDAVMTANNSIPTTLPTLLNFQTTTRNNLGTSTFNGQRLTIGAGMAGLWYVQAAWSFFTPADGIFASMQIRKNGTLIIGEGDYPYNKNGGGTIIQGHTIVPLSLGDYIEAMAYHQAGSTQPAYADARARFFAVLLSAY